MSRTRKPLANSGTFTNVSETIPAGYRVSGISCTGLGGGTASYNVVAGTVQLNAAATANTNDITCAYTNTKLPTVRISKISNGGTETFNFFGDNGFGVDAIGTSTQGVAAQGVTRVLTAESTPTTLSETIPATYFITALNCTGLGGGTASYDMSAGTILLNAAATAPGNVVECTYTNTLSAPAIVLLKTANTPGPVNVSNVITYTYRVTNTGNRPLSNVVVSETAFNGSGTWPTAANEALLTDAAPLGDSNNGSPNDGVWQSLGPGDTITFTATYQVTQNDIDTLQ